MGLTETTAVSFSLAILAATFLLLSTSTAAAPASPLCEAAADRTLCTQLAKGANNWQEAMKNMILAAVEKAKAGKPIAYGVGAKLPGNLLPESKKSIDSTCQEAYETLIFNLNQCIGFVKNDPTSALKHYLSSMTFFDCKFALEEFGVSLPEVNEFDEELLNLSSNLLAVLQKNPLYF